MPAEQGQAPGKKYPDGSGDVDDDILASELTTDELKEAFRWDSSADLCVFMVINNNNS